MHKTRGFTIVELLIVIAIIGLLSAIIMSNLSGSRAKSRDAKRISDISQIQLAIEQYFDRCQEYPTLSSGTTISGLSAATLATITNISACPSGISLGSFISQTPSPTTGTYDYVAKSDKLDYVLHASLETSPDAVRDSLAAAPSGSGWTVSFTCSNAVGSKDYCVGPK